VLEGYQSYTCPVCGRGGASPKEADVPLCHICDYKVTMKPSHNGKILEEIKMTTEMYVVTAADGNRFVAFKDGDKWVATNSGNKVHYFAEGYIKSSVKV